MVSVPPNLQIRTAGQRYLYPHQHFIIVKCRDRHPFDLQILPAVKHGGGHMTVESCGSQGLRTTFKESKEGDAARARACSMLPKGNRCVINSRTGTTRSKTKRADSS